MMSDADVDGSHIRTLLMTFFYRQMPRLVAEGHLYVAQPPLYLISTSKEKRYVQTDAEMHAILIDNGLADASLRPAGADDETEAITGERLRALVEIVSALDNALRAFGRRNLPLRPFLDRAHPGDRAVAALPRRRAGSGRLALYGRGARGVQSGPHPGRRRRHRHRRGGRRPRTTGPTPPASPNSTRSAR